MSDGREWFAPKRYGYGAGVPIAWQGWAATITFVAVCCAIGFTLSDNVVQLVATLIPVAVLFAVIAARTTRGGWRWRWGDSD